MQTADYPTIAQAIKDLGETNGERADAMAVSTKTIERMAKRLPASLKPFLCSPSAESLLLAALADVRARKTGD